MFFINFIIDGYFQIHVLNEGFNCSVQVIHDKAVET